jgi:hypothetical protein
MPCSGPPARGHPLHGLRGRIGVGEVRCDQRMAAALERREAVLEPLLVPAGDDQFGTVAGEMQRSLPADSGGGAGDQDSLAAEAVPGEGHSVIVSTHLSGPTSSDAEAQL